MDSEWQERMEGKLERGRDLQRDRWAGGWTHNRHSSALKEEEADRQQTDGQAGSRHARRQKGQEDKLAGRQVGWQACKQAGRSLDTDTEQDKSRQGRKQQTNSWFIFWPPLPQQPPQAPPHAAAQGPQAPPGPHGSAPQAPHGT